MKRCKLTHDLARFTPYGFPHRNGYLDSVDVAGRAIRTCSSCGSWLPLGPANDDDERVRVEARAAELAHHDFDCADFTQSEWMGWNGDEEYIMCGQFRNVFDDMSEERFAGWEAGVLAAAIAAHDGGE